MSREVYGGILLSTITCVKAQEVLDSRVNPTIEVGHHKSLVGPPRVQVLTALLK